MNITVQDCVKYFSVLSQNTECKPNYFYDYNSGSKLREYLAKLRTILANISESILPTTRLHDEVTYLNKEYSETNLQFIKHKYINGEIDIETNSDLYQFLTSYK